MSAQLKRIAGGTIVGPWDVRTGTDIVITGERIVAIEPATRDHVDAAFDAAGCFVLPGFVDLHMHGAGGRTFNDTDPHSWRDIIDLHLAAGTTTQLPTIMTDSLARLVAQLFVARELLESEDRPASFVGVHLEGPYLAATQRGAHPLELLRRPDDRTWDTLAGFLDVIRLVTLAPELDGADTIIRSCAAAGAVVAAGHSSADEQTLREAAELGLTHVTHLWSGQSVLRKNGPWRNPGLLEAALASDTLTAELIADGHHLPAALVRIGHRCLGSDRACLVSDASAGTGLAPGTHFSMGAADGVVDQGVALTCDGRSFFGSTSFLLDIVRYAVREAGVPLVDAARMAATTPAAVIGLTGELGALSPGLIADITILDQDLRLTAVVQRGRLVDRTERLDA